MLQSVWTHFTTLVRVPFQHEALVWGIVPLYFSWLLNELTSSRVSFNTAIQTGFALVWSGAHWAWQAYGDQPGKIVHAGLGGVFAVNTAVTLIVLGLGMVALWSGLRRRYPRGLRFLGHTRFSSYFMIAIFPLQAGYLAWRWDYVWAIVVCAVPIWVGLHLALAPLRR